MYEYTNDSEVQFQSFNKKNLKTQQSDYTNDTSPIPQIQFDKTKENQQFYKKSCRNDNSGQFILKHGYKAFTIKKSQEDLVMFCLSLLQFQAEFPLRFLMIEDDDKENQKAIKQSKRYKDVWLQTQFLLSSNTSIQQQISKQTGLQNKIYKFFTYTLIPVLRKFKEQRMTWQHMTSQEYTDEKVIYDFRQNVIKIINGYFKKVCKTD